MSSQAQQPAAPHHAVRRRRVRRGTLLLIVARRVAAKRKPRATRSLQERLVRLAVPALVIRRLFAKRQRETS